MTLRCFRDSVLEKKTTQSSDCIPDGEISLAPLKAEDENNTDLASTYRSQGDSMQNTIWMLGSFCSKRSPAALLDEVLKEPVEMAGNACKGGSIPEDAVQVRALPP